MPSLAKLATFSKVLGVPLQNLTELLEIDRQAAPLPRGVRGGTWAELRAAGIAEAEAGRLQTAYACFERALRLLGSEGDRRAERTDVKMDLAIVLKRMCRHYTARDLLEQALSEVATDSEPGRADRALILLAGVLREMDRLPLAAMVAREAMERAARAGDPVREAHAASVLGNALFDLGSFEQGVPLYERAVQAYRANGDAPSLATNLTNLAHALVRLGRVAEALRHLDEARAIAERHGYGRHKADVLACLAQAHRRRGDLALAEKHLLRSNRIARAGDYRDTLFSNIWNLRELALALGRSAEAEDCLRSLRYLRGSVESTSAETRAFDRMFRAAHDGSGEDGAVTS